MDDQAFRRERLLASGLLRRPVQAELALIQRVREAITVTTRAATPGTAPPPRPSYKTGKRLVLFR